MKSIRKELSDGTANLAIENKTPRGEVTKLEAGKKYAVRECNEIDEYWTDAETRFEQ